MQPRRGIELTEGSLSVLGHVHYSRQMIRLLALITSYLRFILRISLYMNWYLHPVALPAAARQNTCSSNRIAFGTGREEIQTIACGDEQYPFGSCLVSRDKVPQSQQESLPYNPNFRYLHSVP